MDREEYERAVREHKDRVHSHAAWVLHELEEARDVAQEALLRLWVNRERIRSETASSWLLKTTHNLCVDRLRRRRVRPQADLETLDLLEDDGTPAPDRSAASRELAAVISRALRELSARDRSAVLMREVHGMTYEEIAAIIDLPMGTLKSVLHRARERLRRALAVAGVTP